MFKKKDNDWLKNRGYLHVTNQHNLSENREELLRKIKDKNFIARHAFFPLLHSVIRERRYKKPNSTSKKKAHFTKDENGLVKTNCKIRPLHYATHIDAIIFGYYAEQLLNDYELALLKFPEASESVIAYRKIKSDNPLKNKGTIHFAKEVFAEIRKRGLKDECCVLKFDIVSFFSRLDHSILKKAWAQIISQPNGLPDDHYNVFKAATRFSYILKDDLRVKKYSSGFDEEKLAGHSKKGIHSFFENAKEMREKIKNNEIKIYKSQFKNLEGKRVGIPQGLPISAILANIYLFDFDIAVINSVVKGFGAYYRRYSDDIVIICKKHEALDILDIIEKLIQDSKLEISREKTEQFSFSMREGRKNVVRLTSIKEEPGMNKIGVPFSYLGFEFYGYMTLIKSRNLAKFYRRMLRAVKSKCRIAKKQVEQGKILKPIIYRRQLYKLFTSLPLNASKLYVNKKWLEKTERGDYVRKVKPIEKKHRSNYISYINRASEIMEEPAIKNQLRNAIKIFNQSIQKNSKL